MFRFSGLFIAMLMLGLSVTVAYSETTPEPTPVLSHDDSLLTQQPCAFPCWHGITPGESTLDDVHKQLQNLAFYTDAEFHDETIDYIPNFLKIGTVGHWYNLHTTIYWYGEGYS